MKTVAVDIDGVVYDIIAHIIDRFRPHLAKLRPPEWDCWPALETNKGEFFKMYSLCWIEAAENKEIANKYTDPAAKKLFTALRRNKNVRTSIITKRSKADIPYTIRYLLEQDFHFDTFTVITDVQDKRKEHFDILIEDNPKNLPDNIFQRGILLTQAWNKNYEVNNINTFRYDNLSSIVFQLRSHLPP